MRHGLLLLICCSNLCRPYEFSMLSYMAGWTQATDHELLVVLVTLVVSTHAARVCHHGVVEKIPRPTHKFMPSFQDGLAHRHGLLRASATQVNTNREGLPTWTFRVVLSRPRMWILV